MGRFLIGMLMLVAPHAHIGGFVCLYLSNAIMKRATVTDGSFVRDSNWPTAGGLTSGGLALVYLYLYGNGAESPGMFMAKVNAAAPQFGAAAAEEGVECLPLPLLGKLLQGQGRLEAAVALIRLQRPPSLASERQPQQ